MARIYPVYLTGLLLTLLVTIILGDIPNQLSLLFTLNTAMLNAWAPHLAMEWYGGGSWSISTEFFFYLVFPLALPLLLRVKNRNILFGLLGLFIILASIPGMLYNFMSGQPNEQGFHFTYSFPPARLGEFIVGIITALLVLRFKWKVPVPVMLTLLVLLALYLIKFGARLQGYTAHNLVALPAIVSCVACLAYSPQAAILRWVGSSWAAYLGRISYSFYIMQLVILAALDIL